MDYTGPTQEQLARDTYEPPQLDQRTARAAWRRKPAYERLRLEPECLAAARRLDRHVHGAAGADVRMDDIPPAWGPPDEYSQHRHARELTEAKRAVGQPRVWQALMATIEETMTPRDMGHQWGGYRQEQQARVYGHTLITTGLETLAIHWGLIRRPDG